MTKTVSRRDALLGTAAAAAALTVSATAADAAQPNMEAALKSLQSARASLEKAKANKAGHRNKAIQLIDQAIGEVKAGMAAAA